MLQPVLVPCKRSADLVLSLDPSDSGMASIYWGTALLQRIPCDGSHPLLRLTAGLLYNLRFPVRKLAACLPLCDKTIRSIGLALRDSSSSEVVQAILGQTGEETLSEDQKQYVRVRYVELRETCRDFRRKIGEEVNRIWGVAVCGEVLRKCFREADAARDRAALCVLPPAVEEAPAGQAEASEQGGSASGGEGLAAALPEPSVETEKGNRGCASDPSPSTVSHNGSSPSEDDDGGEDTAPAAEPAPPCLETEKGNRGCASDPSPSTASRNGSSPSEVGTDDGEPPACQDADADGRDGRIERETGAELPGASVPAPWPLPFPYLPERPQWCAHAGLFTLLPWLEQGLGDAPAEVQQLALQILAGAVNHEGSRYTSFDSLKLLGEPVHRAIRSQRAWCKAHAFDGVLETVLLGNARLAWLHYERVFYFDRIFQRLRP